MAMQILIITQKEGQTKIQALLEGIRDAIATGKLRPGDTLPSVNEMSRMSGFSRDTVVKAYQNLKQQSVISSTPAKGFYVSGKSFRVFMLLDDFSAFKEHLYRSFRDHLPQAYSVDLLFHHYNPAVFEQLVQSAVGRYSMYVIMNISTRQMHPVLSKIDPNKLLVLDMGNARESKYNYLLQNFDTAVVNCLESEKERLSKYSQLIYIFAPDKTPHPPETTGALRTYCRNNGLTFKVVHDLKSNMMVPGQLYFVITENDLVQVLKSCRQNGLSLGADIGIIAYNDTPMKEIAGNGITVISTDFAEMGRKAALFISGKEPVRELLPTYMILRDSV